MKFKSVGLIILIIAQALADQPATCNIVAKHDLFKGI